jgi:hypothetical protein
MIRFEVYFVSYLYDIVLHAEEGTQYLGLMGEKHSGGYPAIDKHRYGNGQENKKIFAFLYSADTGILRVGENIRQVKQEDNRPWRL